MCPRLLTAYRLRPQVTLWLRNLTHLPVSFKWDDTLLGDVESISTAIQPTRGTVKPGGSYRLKVHLNPRRSGHVQVRAVCLVEGARLPVVLTVQAKVVRLNVSYEVHTLDGHVMAYQHVPVFDFGRKVQVGEPVTQVLVIRNNTGIEAPVHLSADSFGVGGVQGRVTEIGGLPLPEFSSASTVARPGAPAGPLLGRASPPRTSMRSPLAGRSPMPGMIDYRGPRVRLGDEHERRAPFRSDLGQTMMKLRKQTQDSESVLGAGRGLAIEITPSDGTLPPFGEFRARITCHTNMFGTYTDEILCAVGDLPVSRFGLKIGVAGTPLVVHKHRRLIRGLPSQPLHDQTRIHLNFGDSAFGSGAQERTFYVFNTSPMEMEISWEVFRTIVHPGLPEDTQTVAVPLEHTAGGLSVNIVPHDYTEGDMPDTFHVEPRTARIQGGQSARFTATFLPPARQSLHRIPGCLAGTVAEVGHWAMLVGRTRLCSVEESEGSLKVVAWTQEEPNKIKLADREQEKEKERKRKFSLKSVGAAVKVLGGLSSRSKEAPVEVILRGSMHPYAGPPAVPLVPLRCSLVARNLACMLEPDPGVQRLRFDVHANLDKSHSSFVRSATFTNMLNTPLAFSVVAKGDLNPFSVISATPSIDQEASIIATVPREGAGPKALVLPARENVEVSVRFTEPEDLEASTKDYSLQGQLMLQFANGDLQFFPLEADVLHPEITASSAEVNFGQVHMKAPKSIKITLTNPTKADAQWAACEKDGKPTFKSTETTARIGPFLVSPAGGVIPGRGLAMPKTQQVTLIYQPQEAKFEDREITFAVYRGRGTDIYVSGEGTFDETQEFRG